MSLENQAFYICRFSFIGSYSKPLRFLTYNIPLSITNTASPNSKETQALSRRDRTAAFAYLGQAERGSRRC